MLVYKYKYIFIIYIVLYMKSLFEVNNHLLRTRAFLKHTILSSPHGNKKDQKHLY